MLASTRSRVCVRVRTRMAIYAPSVRVAVNKDGIIQTTHLLEKRDTVRRVEFA